MDAVAYFLVLSLHSRADTHKKKTPVRISDFSYEVQTCGLIYLLNPLKPVIHFLLHTKYWAYFRAKSIFSDCHNKTCKNNGGLLKRLISAGHLQQSRYVDSTAMNDKTTDEGWFLRIWKELVVVCCRYYGSVFTEGLRKTATNFNQAR
jgi:hypothetical protein